MMRLIYLKTCLTASTPPTMPEWCTSIILWGRRITLSVHLFIGGKLYIIDYGVNDRAATGVHGPFESLDGYRKLLNILGRNWKLTPVNFVSASYRDTPAFAAK